MKTVASISFLDNHSLSMDIEDVQVIEMTTPMELDTDLWTSSLLIRANTGTVAIQFLADSPERLTPLSGRESE